MKITNNGINEIYKITNQLINLRPWKVELGYGSFVTFEFGKLLSNRRSPRSEWLLWIYMAPWEIRKDSKLLVSSQEKREQIISHLGMFQERKLERITIKNNFSTEFSYEGNCLFKTLPLLKIMDDDDDINWKLFTPDEMVLSIGYGKCLKYVPGNMPRSAPSTIDFYSF